MALMPEQWERGKTAKRLAAEWRCELAVVEQASAEAWRRLKAQDATWVRGVLCSRLLKALESADDIEDLRDQIRAVVEVTKAWTPLVGAGAPTKHELSGPSGGPIQVAGLDTFMLLVVQEVGPLQGGLEALARIQAAMPGLVGGAGGAAPRALPALEAAAEDAPEEDGDDA